MKKLYWLLASFLFILFSINSCKEIINNLYHPIYTPNHEWIFTVKRSDSPTIDTIILKTGLKSLNGGKFTQIKNSQDNKSDSQKVRPADSFIWILLTSDSTGTKRIADTAMSRIDNPDIEYSHLPSPKNQYLKHSEWLPSMFVRMPVYIGYTSTSKHSVSYTEEKERNREWTNELKVTGKEFYKNPNVNDNCWVINATGENLPGKYKAKYYYHEKKGFVYMLYDFETYKVEIELLSMK